MHRKNFCKVVLNSVFDTDCANRNVRKPERSIDTSSSLLYWAFRSKFRNAQAENKETS